MRFAYIGSTSWVLNSTIKNDLPFGRNSIGYDYKIFYHKMSNFEIAHKRIDDI